VKLVAMYSDTAQSDTALRNSKEMPSPSVGRSP
jgi:hypothetical protein